MLKSNFWWPHNYDRRLNHHTSLSNLFVPKTVTSQISHGFWKKKWKYLSDLFTLYLHRILLPFIVWWTLILYGGRWICWHSAVGQTCNVSWQNFTATRYYDGTYASRPQRSRIPDQVKHETLNFRTHTQKKEEGISQCPDGGWPAGRVLFLGQHSPTICTLHLWRMSAVRSVCTRFWLSVSSQDTSGKSSGGTRSCLFAWSVTGR